MGPCQELEAVVGGVGVFRALLEPGGYPNSSSGFAATAPSCRVRHLSAQSRGQPAGSVTIAGVMTRSKSIRPTFLSARAWLPACRDNECNWGNVQNRTCRAVRGSWG